MNILWRITVRCTTAMQREQLRDDHVEKRERFALLAPSSLLGSY